MRILCVYATRQIDSNLFMSSTVFNGLSQCRFEVDLIFWGYGPVCDVFHDRYSKFFRKIYYHRIHESKLSKLSKRNDKTQVIYSYYRSFCMDSLKRPYHIKDFASDINDNYDVILSFIPPAVSGYLAHDIHKEYCANARLVQFWTDPLSLGRCNDVSEIPWTRGVHVTIERELLSYADKVVFCYPLLCEMERRLHPQFSEKLFWSDVGYTEHKLNPDPRTRPHVVSVGLFGSYHSKVRNIMPYLEAIKSFSDVRFVLRGDSDISMDASLFPNLDYKEGRRPVNEIEREEAYCDILVCLGGKSGITHPAGKVFYYADYKKPIIYIGDGVHNDFFKRYLNEFGRYIICDNDVNSIRKAIQEALEDLPHFILTIPHRLEPRVVARTIVE